MNFFLSWRPLWRRFFDLYNWDGCHSCCRILFGHSLAWKEDTLDFLMQFADIGCTFHWVFLPMFIVFFVFLNQFYPCLSIFIKFHACLCMFINFFYQFLCIFISFFPFFKTPGTPSDANWWPIFVLGGGRLFVAPMPEAGSQTGQRPFISIDCRMAAWEEWDNGTLWQTFT